MTNIQARKVAWAFADTASLIREDKARGELVTQMAARLRIIEHEINWRPLLEKCLEQCMEERAKEQRAIKDAERLAETSAKAAGG